MIPQPSPSPSPSATRTKNARELYRHTDAQVECPQQQPQQQPPAEWTRVDERQAAEFESPRRDAPNEAAAAAVTATAVDAQLRAVSEQQLAQHIRSRLARRAVEKAEAARPVEHSGPDVTAASLITAPQQLHSKEKEKEYAVGATSLDSNQQAALQAEIERLQAQLQSARAAAAAAAGGTATATTTTATAKSIVAPAGWTSPRAAHRASSARERVRQREQNLRHHISSTARFYTLLVLHTLLAQLSSAKDTALVRAAMALPGVRDLAMLLSDVGVSLAEWALHSSWFLMLPCAGWVAETTREPALERAWLAVPEWPLEEVKPWTEGPLRPLFALLAALPLASLVFELRPRPDEDGLGEAALSVMDGPLAAALKRGEEVPVNGPAAALSPKAIAAPAHAQRLPISEAVPLPSLTSGAAAATDALQQPLLHDLFARVEAQQALIALLQQDRAQLHSAVSRLETLVLQQQQQQQAAQDTADDAESEADVVTSGLRHRRGASSSASASTATSTAAVARRATELLQSEDSASHALLQSQRTELASMRVEMEALQERICQLEQESLVTRSHQQEKTTTTTATATATTTAL